MQPLGHTGKWMATKATIPETPVSLRDLLRNEPMPEWIREMIAHYYRTGTYRPEDLRRLLGDPNKRVEFRSETSLSSFLADLQSQPSKGE
jgi:hypothetical protein